jgi:hypothetical protein
MAAALIAATVAIQALFMSQRLSAGGRSWLQRLNRGL